MFLTCMWGILLARTLLFQQPTIHTDLHKHSVSQSKSVCVQWVMFVVGGCMQSLKILPPWPGHDLLTSHNLWLVNLEPCTLHSTPPAPPNPTLLVGGGKDYQCKLQRVRTCTSTIGVPNAASNCYLHKGSPFNVYNYTRSAKCCCPCASNNCLLHRALQWCSCMS